MIIKIISIKEPIKSEQVNDINHLNGNDSFSPHSPKVINAEVI